MFLTNTETYPLELTSFETGAIQFIPATEGRPESIDRRSDTLEIRNAAIPPTPAHFLASFFISSALEADEMNAECSVELTIAVPGRRNTPYDQIEDDAARQMPDLLRELADLIQKDLDRSDAERSGQD